MVNILNFLLIIWINKLIIQFLFSKVLQSFEARRWDWLSYRKLRKCAQSGRICACINWGYFDICQWFKNDCYLDVYNNDHCEKMTIKKRRDNRCPFFQYAAKRPVVAAVPVVA